MISLTTVRMDSVAEEQSRDGSHRVVGISSGDFGGKLMVTRRTGRAVREVLAEALGVLVSRVAGGEYGERHLILVEEDRDLLENVEASLLQRSLAMVRMDDIGGEPGLVGKVPDHLVDTLWTIYEAGSITNADLAKKLGLNHTACNNRATRLAKLGLIRRKVETAAPGGRQYSYERIA
jgi:hypothetical protein